MKNFKFNAKYEAYDEMINNIGKQFSYISRSGRRDTGWLDTVYPHTFTYRQASKGKLMVMDIDQIQSFTVY